MKKKLKLIAFIVALAFFVVPSVSAAVYVPEYLENSAALLENWESVAWTESGETEAGVAYYFVYEDAGAEYYWYWSEKDGYTAQWLLYTDGVSGDAEYFSYVAALDDSYSEIYERYGYDFGADQLEYSFFDDGSYNFEEFDVYGEWEGRDVSYYWSLEEYASGSYFYYADYDSWDGDLSWYYGQEYDLDWAASYEWGYLWDVANEAYWYYDYEESLESGAFSNYEWEYTISSEYDAGWSYEYVDYTETESYYSPDYSETWSSYYYEDYQNDWWYSEFESNITDSGYYYMGTEYYNWMDGEEWEYSYAGFDNWTIYNDGEGQEAVWSSYYTGKDKGYDDWYYQTNTYSYTASDEFYYYQYGYDYNTGSRIWQQTEYEAQDTDWWDDFYQYEYDSEGTLLSYVWYYYEGTDATGYEAIEDYSRILQAEGDMAYVESYTWSTYDPTRGDTREGYTYEWYDDPGNYYWEKEETIQGAPNGDRYSESSRYAYDVDGNGYWTYTESSYDAAYQESFYEENEETYTNGYTTYDYYWYGRTLADSDERYYNWSERYRDEDTGSTLTYESGWYELDTDAAEESWYYQKDDYTGVNNTYYDEWSWESLASGATEESWSFQISGVSDETYSLYQGLDSYDEYKSFDEYGVSYTWSSYSLLTASGSQTWDAYEYDYVTNDWSETMLTATDGVWTGEKLMYDWSTSQFDIYLYYNYPDGYFFEEDIYVPI